ncbi:MAG: AbrB/MazE/SpoVT family DNA-binding domain-containing protein [Pseudomonadota bacterium]
MTIASSKVTAQGQISVPQEVRRKLGLSPGSVLEWIEDKGAIRVQRSTQHTSEDIHRRVFARKPAPKTLDELKDGIRKHARSKHARG